jgi:hypothetical protein
MAFDTSSSRRTHRAYQTCGASRLRAQNFQPLRARLLRRVHVLRITFAIAVALLFALGSSGVEAQASESTERSEPERSILLGQWFEVQAAQQRVERRFTGGAMLGVGAAGFAFGLARLLRDAPANELSKGGSIGLIAGGAFGIGVGIFRLVVRSEAEEVDERWRRLPARDQSDPTVLARFEGELYAAAQHARRIQQLTRWLGLATALGGATVIVATPFAGLSEGGRTAAYVGGGLLMLGGGINVGSSLATPPPCKAWEAYQRGEPPGSSRRRLFGFVPWFRPDAAGLSFAGRIGVSRAQ